MRELHVEGLTLEVNGDGEPRIRDTDLATRLGYARPKDIRELIKRHVEAGILPESSVRRTVRRTRVGVAERDVTEYWLTEEQAIYIAAKSDTEKAGALLRVVIHVFVLARRGLLPPAAEPPAWVAAWTLVARAVVAEALISAFGSLAAIRTALIFELGGRERSAQQNAVRHLQRVEYLEGNLRDAARIFLEPARGAEVLAPGAYRETAPRLIDGLAGFTWRPQWEKAASPAEGVTP